ncbi:MAG: recombinase family protein [Provencibacterium sp.]|jgi:site-specific DNA recombinase|nr:recombinase family protein [Provencibacterium sp.]
MNSKEYLIYLRKSRADMEAEAHGEGETLARHEAALLETARRMRLNVTAIYREVVSGETISSRPKMQQLLNEVEQGLWAGVLVMEVERLARGDTIDQGIVAQAFKYSSTKIITPVKTYDPNDEFDEEYFEFGLFMSRREYKMINRRLQRGRLASINEGKYVGNKTPYGYTRIKLERDKGYTLQPHPEQAEVVRMIYQLYTVGETQPDGTLRPLGASLIAQRLDDLGIEPATGGKWSSATIRGILTHPVYIGKVRWNHRPSVKHIENGQMYISRPRRKEDCVVVDGLHPPIIEQSVWEAAQGILKKRQHLPLQPKRGLRSPLAGIVICGVCGRHMVCRPYNNGYPDTLICPNRYCNNVSSQLASVEQRILAALEEWLQDYRIKIEKSGTDKPNDLRQAKEKALKKLDDSLENLHKQVDNIHNLLEQGVYNIDTFLARSKALAERLKETQEARENLAADISREISLEQARRDIIPRVEHVLDVYRELPTPKDKNDLLKSILEKVVYEKHAQGRWGNPEDYAITLYPHLPKIGG